MASTTEAYLGGYDPEKRRKEVLAKLQEGFDRIRKSNLHLKVLGEGKSGKAGRPDIITLQLETILEDVETLKANVAEFLGPHFTKIYRTLQGDCSKLQLDLDGLDITGREDIREKRRAALIEIDEIAKQLAGKAHKDGKSCPGCELRD